MRSGSGVEVAWTRGMMDRPVGRRRIVLGLYITCLVAVVVATGTLIGVSLSSSGKADYRVAIASIILGCGTTLLALIAALVALQAYAVTTGLPDLKIQLQFGPSSINRPTFAGRRNVNGWPETVDSVDQTVASLRIKNIGHYAAEGMCVMLHLCDIVSTMNREILSTDWWATEWMDLTGVTTFQWDASPEFVVHGHSVRRLPAIDLGTLRQIRVADPSFEVVLLANGGYRRLIKVPVRFMVGDVRDATDFYSTPTWL